MSCTFDCIIDPWIKGLFLSFGAAGAFIVLGLILLVWGSRKVRREYVTPTTTWGMIFKMNWPAFLFMGLGTFTLLATIIVGIASGVMK